MKTKTYKPRRTIKREFAIYCFSDMRAANGERDAFAPSLWPNQSTQAEAETFAAKHVKNTRWEVRPVYNPAWRN